MKNVENAEVEIEEDDSLLGWAVLPSEQSTPSVSAFFPSFRQAAAYAEQASSDPNSDVYIGDPCIVAAALSDKGFLLANDYDYERGARGLAKYVGARADYAKAFEQEGKEAMNPKHSVAEKQATCGKKAILAPDVVAAIYGPPEDQARELTCERGHPHDGAHCAEGWEWQNGVIRKITAADLARGDAGADHE